MESVQSYISKNLRQNKEMGLLQKLFSKEQPEERSVSGVVTWDDIASDTKTMNRDKALTVSAVFRAVFLIATSLGKLPLEILERNEQGKEKAYSHPAFNILRYQFNTEMGAKTVKQALTAHALLQGDGYGVIIRDHAGNPTEILPLEPNTTFPFRENGKLWYLVTINNKQRNLAPVNVLHIRGLSWDGLTSLSVLQFAARSFGVAVNCSKHTEAFFNNSARPSVILEHPGKLSPEAAKKLKADWERMNKGVKKSQGTVVLEEGLKANPFSMSAKDAQLIEALRWTIVDIANWFGMPPHKLGDSSKSSYNSLENENQSFLDDTLDNWLVTWEEECREKLLTEKQKSKNTHLVEFNRKALVRADLKTRGEYYIKATGGAAWMSVNEVRSAENMNTAKSSTHDYDEVIQPTNNFDPDKGKDKDEDENDNGNENPATDED